MIIMTNTVTGKHTVVFPKINNIFFKKTFIFIREIPPPPHPFLILGAEDGGGEFPFQPCSSI